MAQPMQASPDVEGLIQRLNSAVALGTPGAICEGVKRTLIDLATEQAASIPDEFFEASPDSYARRLLYRCPDSVYSVMIMVWGVGQGTEVHDHAGKWCVECVLRGRIEIASYDPHGDPSADDPARLTPSGSVIANVGEVGILVPPNEYHSIRNAGDTPAVTMHVYAGEMLWCHTFHALESGGFRRERCDLSYT